MKAYNEIKLERLSNRISTIRQQINNHRINIKKSRAQIANLMTQIERLNQLKDNIIKHQTNNDNI